MGPPPAPAAKGKKALSPEKGIADLSHMDPESAKITKRMIDTNEQFWKCYPRIMIDISWKAYLREVLHSLLPFTCPAEQESRKQIGKAFLPKNPSAVVAALSVRTFTDCLLRALNLPPGSEILMSGISIPTMLEIFKHHKLVPKAFDIEIDTFTPDVEQARRMITPKTKVLLVAPLFGRTMRRLGELKALAKEKGLLFFVDGAQTYGIRDHADSIEADVLVYSFGFIKFSTALGGSIGVIRDQGLRERWIQAERSLPQRSTGKQVFNLIKAFAVLFVDDPITYGVVRRIAESVGVDTPDVVHKFTRGFPGPELMPLIRFRPHPATLALLHSRVAEADNRRKIRALSGWHIMSQLPPYVQCVSAGDPDSPLDSTFWLFVFCVRNPLAVCQIFHQHGFDSSLGASQMCAAGTSTEAPISHAVIQHILYIPLAVEIGDEDRARVVELFKKIPRAAIESPLPSFHQHVASRPQKHAYRSDAISALLKDKPVFKDPPSTLLNLVAGPLLGSLLFAKL